MEYAVNLWLVIIGLFVAAAVITAIVQLIKEKKIKKQEEETKKLYKFLVNEQVEINERAGNKWDHGVTKDYFHKCNAVAIVNAGYIHGELDDPILETVLKKRIDNVKEYDKFNLFPNINNRVALIFLVDFVKCYLQMGYKLDRFSKENLSLILTVIYLLDYSSEVKSISYDKFTYYEPAVSKALEIARVIEDIGKSIKVKSYHNFSIEYILYCCDLEYNTPEDVKEPDFISALQLPMEIMSEYALCIAQANGEVSAKDLDYINSTFKDNQFGLDNKFASKALDEDKVQNSLNKLNELVGLESVKEDIRRLTDFIRIQQLRFKEGLKTSPISYHCVFTGNPGTGKTTVARIIADIYKELGILKKGHLVETDRSGLVAEYVGQTAVKTNKIINSALDGVLFIDEAYSLAGSNNDFGPEAIATLLKRMEDDRKRLVVILAGYGDEMKTFIDSNPGLQSRFNRYIHFEDYDVDDLITIFLGMVKKHEYILSDDAVDKLREKIQTAIDEKDRNFGNARFVRNLFEKTLENQAGRLASSSEITRSQLQTISAADI